ncbi:MAG: histidine kinase [Bdellovibrionota bacterium]
MSSEKALQLKPLLSVLIIIISFFSLAFFQMEERRLGYNLLKLNRDHRESLEQKRSLEVQLAKITKPQLLNQVAQSRLTLKKLQSNQIIHLSGPVKFISKKRDL